jgi:hypothetical protein
MVGGMTFKEAFGFFEQARDAAREAESVAAKAVAAVEELQGSTQNTLAEFEQVAKSEHAAVEARLQEKKAAAMARLAEVEEASLAAEETKVIARKKANTLAKQLDDLLKEEIKKN